MNTDQIINLVSTHALPIAIKLVGGILIWIIGKWLIGKAMTVLKMLLNKRQIDPTLQSYATSILSGLLLVVLIVAILGFFGVETTTFAAILAGAGLAIGTAWGGLLQNFAAGAFLIVLRPFTKGDYVVAGGTEGTVEEIGMFVTAINTPDNVKTLVANNKIFSETIKNFSANPYRRVELKAQLAHGADHQKAIDLLKAALAKIDGVKSDPAPAVTVLEFNPMGPVLAVRPFCHTDVYWDVYFASNQAIRETLGGAGFEVAETHTRMKTVAA